MLARWLSAEVKLYELKNGTNMSLKAASTLMANIMNGRRYMPFWVQLLLGGIDSDGGHVYSLDAAGGSIPDKFQTTGSGSPFVYGVLEDRFKENMSVKDGKELGVRALTAAMKRDSASGMHLATRTPKGSHSALGRWRVFSSRHGHGTKINNSKWAVYVYRILTEGIRRQECM